MKNDSQYRNRLHPEMLHFYDQSNGYDLFNLEEFRKKVLEAELVDLRETEGVRAYDREINGTEAGSSLMLRIYEPTEKKTDALPALLFFHGGGFLFGSRFRHSALCALLSKSADCVVISVDYRLAPEFKAPAPVEDGYTALLWLCAHADELGVDTSRIALAGTSAGGNITAALTIMARDRNGPPIIFQMPMEAELDSGMATPSALSVTDMNVWSTPYTKVSWQAYLPKDTEINGYISPSAEPDLSGLPPLFSYVGGEDSLRDENVNYWQRLMEAGVPVECHVYPGCFHGFDTCVPEAAYSRHAYQAAADALREAFWPTKTESL